ncbi:hypothetical protein JCM19241_317 [Vibrio ishigakensis]|uniref:Uncharacterized protein n=1 Tax=Vibrio ishigakensis TaxID=1481914 RepID=A0A0B8QNQ3_9VIBR|nr:hypothetical protein JCM19241_317 [Vibrio ishigakensis]
MPEALKDRPVVLANCFCDDPSVPCYVPDDAMGQYAGSDAC